MEEKQFLIELQRFIRLRLIGKKRTEFDYLSEKATTDQLEQLMFFDFIVSFYPEVAKEIVANNFDIKEPILMAAHAWKIRAELQYRSDSKIDLGDLAKKMSGKN